MKDVACPELKDAPSCLYAVIAPDVCTQYICSLVENHNPPVSEGLAHVGIIIFEV